jgi:hypothetical protein
MCGVVSIYGSQPGLVGEVRAEGFEELRSSFDTRGLLRAVEEIDRFCAQWKKELRDVEVHKTAHTVINGASLTAAPGEETLPGAAYTVGEEFREWRESLAAAIALLDQIAGLEPD